MIDDSVQQRVVFDVFTIVFDATIGLAEFAARLSGIVASGMNKETMYLLSM